MYSEFERILNNHRARYPLMEPQDYGKLVYQSEFGPEHMIADEESVLRYLREEWALADEGDREPEDIGGGLCRFYLNADTEKDFAAEVLVKLFDLTAKKHIGSLDGLAEKLSVLEKMPVPGMQEWLQEYRAAGCPAVHHSEAYRKAYRPHYRLLKKEYAAVFPALVETAKLLKQRERAVVAIDGRCGSGKSALGELMREVFSCNVFHMDDFYLPREQRTENWMERPGGNMDLVRLKREVLDQVFVGQAVDSRRFDCGAGAFAQSIHVQPARLTVIEGSYSHHPALEADYDLKIFITCEEQERLRRLREREGDYFPTFRQLWMPLEEQYIRLCAVEERAALVIDTGALFL